MKTKIVLLDKNAVIPTRAHIDDTGYDLRAISVKKVEGDVVYLGTGISIQPPEGYYFEIFPRSSISKLPAQLANSVGVIDRTYTGELIIPLRITHSQMGQDVGNAVFPAGIVKILNQKPSTLKAVGEAILKDKPIIVQLVLRQRLDAEFEVVESLEQTQRGDGGFGSTDKK